MKRNILILSVILILVFAVSVSGEVVFSGIIGDCPDSKYLTCNTNIQCPSPRLENCAPGYYCTNPGSTEDLNTCEYAGAISHCTIAGGTWDFVKNGCLKQTATDILFEGACNSCNFGDCINGPEVFHCFEGSYCAETERQAYCAPPDFSQEHCTVAGGIWNGIIKRCTFTIPFNGKGNCPDQPGPCNSKTQCPNPGNENCASGYYCAEEATLWGCQYAGSYTYCSVAGGTWDWEKNACIKTVGLDLLLEGSCDSCNLGSCINQGEVFNCFEGSYCADSGGQVSCAPPDFSQKHCGEAGGTWDATNLVCEKEDSIPEVISTPLPYNGKGDCPDLFDTCTDSTTCGGGESCEEGHYCLYTDVAVCFYAGATPGACTTAGGTWDWKENGCYKNSKFEGSCDFCNDFDSCALASGEPYCFEGSYCAKTGGQAYCAPPSFSQEHCTTSGGTWDATNLVCEKAASIPEPVSTCGDGKCNKKEDYFNCAKDCKLSSESLKLLKIIEKKMCLKPNDICCKRLQRILNEYKKPKAKEIELRQQITTEKVIKKIEPKTSRLSIFTSFTRLKERFRKMPITGKFF